MEVGTGARLERHGPSVEIAEPVIRARISAVEAGRRGRLSTGKPCLGAVRVGAAREAQAGHGKSDVSHLSLSILDDSSAALPRRSPCRLPAVVVVDAGAVESRPVPRHECRTEQRSSRRTSEEDLPVRSADPAEVIGRPRSNSAPRSPSSHTRAARGGVDGRQPRRGQQQHEGEDTTSACAPIDCDGEAAVEWVEAPFRESGTTARERL